MPKPTSESRMRAQLEELSLDLFWSWSHAGDSVWHQLDPVVWEKTENPRFLLQNLPAGRLEQCLRDTEFQQCLKALVQERQRYRDRRLWTSGIREQVHKPQGIAYFSMEFGLSEALPLYAGGLGMLAGDYLKAASDLGIPVIGVGLLYQEGFCRQFIDASGHQAEAYPYNEPANLPIGPVLTREGNQLRIDLELPGRRLSLRIWQATVGRIKLYLLDSNDLLNSPTDRGITAKLYTSDPETRFLQEMVLGFGGWRVVEALNFPIDICHLNEGHSALVILARTLSVMARTGRSFWPAFWIARAGTIFTTHTPVSEGFDRFSPIDVPLSASYMEDYFSRHGIEADTVLALGRLNPNDSREAFNMTWLAIRGSAMVNGVSARHAQVSRHLFAPLYPRWPEHEVPVSHITNGVHTPSWDSKWADELWTRACGKDRWCGTTEDLPAGIGSLSDQDVWSFRAQQRSDLIGKVRHRLAAQQKTHAGARAHTDPDTLFDPNVLTLAIARRFTDYKRVGLLLRDPARFKRLLTNPNRPIQVVIAGKAHPSDLPGKKIVAKWIAFTEQADVSHRIVFLEDYDIRLAQELVAGVDVWINTPRAPMEACGTSGMKILVNGGLNLSVPDGWWAEAHDGETGWAVGQGEWPDGTASPLTETEKATIDEVDAEALYQVLEHDVIPEFYDRPEGALPTAWIKRVRTSMARLAPHFSANRMVRDYYENHYCPAALAYRERLENDGKLGQELDDWEGFLTRHWNQIHFGALTAEEQAQQTIFSIQVYLGEICPDDIRVELYADTTPDGLPAACHTMTRADCLTGAEHGYLFRLSVSVDRPPTAFTPRVVAHNEHAFLPAELPLIRWQH